MDSELLDEWLDLARRERWTFHFVPGHENPEVIGGVLVHSHPYGEKLGLSDVWVLLGEDHAVAYRCIVPVGGDPFRPKRILWVYGNTPVWTIRAALSLPGPGNAEAPAEVMDAPEAIREIGQRFVGSAKRTIRPPQFPKQRGQGWA